MTIEELQAREAELNRDYQDAAHRATRIRTLLDPSAALQVRVGTGDQDAAEDLEALRVELYEIEARADKLFRQREAVRGEIGLAENRQVRG